MTKRCSVCLLPESVQADLETMNDAGVSPSECLSWLASQGHGHITRAMWDNHRSRRHSDPSEKLPSELEVITTTDKTLDELMADPGISATEAHRRVIRASLEQCDRIRAFAKSKFNLRTERVLNEAIQTAGRLLSEVSYDGTED